MIEITNKIKDYNDTRINSESIIEIKNDWSDNNFVILKVGEKSFKLLARDLEAAIKNATNTGRF